MRFTLGAFVFAVLIAVSATAYIMPGVLANRSGTPTFYPPLCTVVAENAWPFNTQIDGTPFSTTKSFDNFGSVGTADFFCGPDEHGFDCPTFLPSGGPFGRGAAHFDDPDDGDATHVELRTNYASATQDCSQEGELTVAFHLKALVGPGGSGEGRIGDRRVPIAYRTGVFWSGAANGFVSDLAHKPCMNVAVVDDLWGVSDGPGRCGNGAGDGDRGLGANTDDSSAPGNNEFNITFDTWHHVAFTFSDEGEQGAGNGRYLVYVDGVLVNSVDNAITGNMPNTTNRWTLGNSLTTDWSNFVIANLQLECDEWTLARVNQADECAVPASGE